MEDDKLVQSHSPEENLNKPMMCVLEKCPDKISFFFQLLLEHFLIDFRN